MRVPLSIIRSFVVFLLLFGGACSVFAHYGSPYQVLTAGASLQDSSGELVGTTYYGGNYDDATGKWIIDNKNQCDRIKAGEFSASSLDAVVNPSCSDDNGLGYENDTPLHNTVSFAELSNDASNPDYAALGDLAAGTKLEIQYKNTCVIAEKLDVGDGGDAVDGVHRSLDLWWQTARAIGFTNGWDVMTVRLVDQSTPLSPLGGSSECGTGKPVASTITNASQPTPDNTTTNPSIAQTSQTLAPESGEQKPEVETATVSQKKQATNTPKVSVAVSKAVKSAKKKK